MCSLLSAKTPLMKKLTLLLALSMCLTQISIVHAQDSTSKRIKEIYLGVSSLSPLFVTFKFKQQIGKKLFVKMALNDLTVSYNESYYSGSNSTNSVFSKTKHYSIGAATGIEFRRHLSERFTCFHGPGVSGRFYRNYDEAESASIPGSGLQSNAIENWSFGGNYSIGLLFKVNKHFLLSTEVGPGVYYSKSISTRYNDVTLQYDKNNGSSMYYSFSGSTYVTLVYRF